MIKRVFMLGDSDVVALQRLGAAVVLQWANIPPGVQDSIVQQALAFDWTTDPEAAAHRLRALVASGSRPSE
jgi:hypothetical protein